MAYIIRKKLHAVCPFCEEKVKPNYTDPKRLRGFMTEKGKIISRARSGVCMKHQKELSLGIKRARHLALLSYVSVIK